MTANLEHHYAAAIHVDVVLATPDCLESYGTHGYIDTLAEDEAAYSRIHRFSFDANAAGITALRSLSGWVSTTELWRQVWELNYHVTAAIQLSF